MNAHDGPNSGFRRVWPQEAYFSYDTDSEGTTEKPAEAEFKTEKVEIPFYCTFCEQKIHLAGFTLIVSRIRFGEVSHVVEQKHFCNRDCLVFWIKREGIDRAIDLMTLEQ